MSQTAQPSAATEATGTEKAPEADSYGGILGGDGIPPRVDAQGGILGGDGQDDGRPDLLPAA